MRRANPMITAAVLLLAAGGTASAQSPGRFELTSSAAYVVPLRELGPSAPAGGDWFVRLERMEPAFAVAGSLQASWPGARLITRVHGLAALPADVPGNFSCYPGLACPEVLLRTTARATAWAAVADLAWRPLSPERSLRPYGLIGAGVRGYYFSWPNAAVLVAAGNHSETALAVHAGVGLELDLVGAPLRLEVADYWTGRGRRLGGPELDGVAPARRAAQHDLSVSLGWRLLQF